MPQYLVIATSEDGDPFVELVTMDSTQVPLLEAKLQRLDIENLLLDGEVSELGDGFTFEGIMTNLDERFPTDPPDPPREP